MTSRERVFAVLNHETPDYTPIVPKIAFASVLACEDLHVREYMTDPRAMAKACIAFYRKFGVDSISVHTDIGSEGRAIGSQYRLPLDSPSELERYLLDSLEDERELEKVKVPNPREAEPMKTVIRACEIVKEETGDEAFVIGWTNGPINVASQLVNLNELLLGMVTDPQTVHKLLEICTQVACVYAEELVKAGVDAVAYGHASASATVISPQFYEEFALPYERRIVETIHRAGAKAITHICGNTAPIIDLIKTNGADIIDFDHVCDLEMLHAAAPDKVFRGNINPATFAVGTPQEIRREVEELMKKPAARSCLLLGSGCEINMNTKLENLYEFVKTGRELGKK